MKRILAPALAAGLTAASLLGVHYVTAHTDPAPAAMTAPAPGTRLYSPGTGYVYQVLAPLADGAALCRRDDGLVLAVGGDWLVPLVPVGPERERSRP